MKWCYVFQVFIVDNMGNVLKCIVVDDGDVIVGFDIFLGQDNIFQWQWIGILFVVIKVLEYYVIEIICQMVMVVIQGQVLGKGFVIFDMFCFFVFVDRFVWFLIDIVDVVWGVGDFFQDFFVGFEIVINEVFLVQGFQYVGIVGEMVVLVVYRQWLVQFQLDQVVKDGLFEFGFVVCCVDIFDMQDECVVG